MKAIGFMTLFLLIGGELTGWCSKDLDYQLFGSNHPRVCSACSSHFAPAGCSCDRGGGAGRVQLGGGGGVLVPEE